MSVQESARGRHVAKLGYSVNPWRIVDETGEQLWRDEVFDHPMLGNTLISRPVCFARKRDAVAWLAEHADSAPAEAAS